MITIEYCEDGEAFSDFDLELFIEELQETETLELQVSTSNVIKAVTLAIVQDKLVHSDIQFMFNEQLISVNEFGVIQDWPDGFADIEAKMCEELITLGIQKRKLLRGK